MVKHAEKRETEYGIVHSDGQYRSPAERRAEGKALRDTVSRASHSGWKPPKGRRDPVELLIGIKRGEVPELVPIRLGRMSQSPFAYYRGSAALMAADLAQHRNLVSGCKPVATPISRTSVPSPRPSAT